MPKGKKKKEGKGAKKKKDDNKNEDEKEGQEKKEFEPPLPSDRELALKEEYVERSLITQCLLCIYTTID